MGAAVHTPQWEGARRAPRRQCSWGGVLRAGVTGLEFIPVVLGLHCCLSRAVTDLPCALGRFLWLLFGEWIVVGRERRQAVAWWKPEMTDGA